MPGRSLGLAWFEVDRSARTLKVEVAAPAQMRPRGDAAICRSRSPGSTPGEEARVTVAAVDVGILNLTRYETPDPGRVLLRPEAALDGAARPLRLSHRRHAGHARRDPLRRRRCRRPSRASRRRRSRSPATRAWSRSGRTGPPRSRSTSRPSTAPCASWRSPGAATRVGSASADVIVRDPVVVTGTLPRFLSVGDLSRFHMQVDNVEGPAGDYTLDVDVHGPVVLPADALRKTFRLDAGAKTPVTIPVTAAGPGLAVVDVKLTGPEHRGLAELPRRASSPAPPALVRRTVRPLEAGASLTVSQRPPGRHPARHRRGVGLGIAARRARRAGAAAGARPLSLWLLRADRQPGAAAALRQQARGDGGAGAR